ncbi:LrgB family protein [Psychromonas sp. RZ22]|uniref:LrgB family protein n=1 Tax=Psychromonas algarum TaxID=2555643 RepID=UPI001068C1BA|nr:LrgB family protein [Psychromonas sp. RZ22]TEW54564.1 LrgB family protein [Psychromonas sp. RZ22]
MHPLIPFVYLAFTVLCYYLSKAIYNRTKFILFVPLIFVPIILLILVSIMHIDYSQYIAESHWLLWMLGPATIAFAIPVYENRHLMVQHWRSLTVGVLVAVLAGVGSTVLLSRLFSLSELLQRSLAMRSITTPFAIEATKSVGGQPDLTAVFVVITGVVGILFGELILGWLSIGSHHGKGAGMGACAHGAGTATAYKIHDQAGVIASLVMMLSGVLTVLSAPLLGHILW